MAAPLNLLQLWHQLVPSGTRTIYVSAANGSDSNNGLTIGTAYQSINGATAAALPGDRILVDNSGTYGYTSIYGVNGTAKAWISIEPLTSSIRPVINVANNSGDDGFDIQLSSYIGVYGFEIVGLQTSTNTNSSGVGIFRQSSWIRIWNNLVHDFPGGGINCFYATSTVYMGNTLPAGGWDCVDLAFNTIYNCCKYNPDNTSGISFYAAVDYTGQTLDGTYGYRAIGNYIYNCECLVDYTPGGDNFVTDGNGMSFDSLYVPNSLNPGLAPYVKYGLSEGNICVGNGGRGLHIYNTINVNDYFNTYIGNLTNVTGSSAITNGVETDTQYNPTLGVANNVTRYGNIICPLNTPNTTDAVCTYTNNIILGGTQTVPSGNTNLTTTGVAYFAGNITTTTLSNSLPMSSFIPVSTNSATKQAGCTGYQALGNGPRPKTTWAAGALEQSLPIRVAIV